MRKRIKPWQVQVGSLQALAEVDTKGLSHLPRRQASQNKHSGSHGRALGKGTRELRHAGNDCASEPLADINAAEREAAPDESPRGLVALTSASRPFTPQLLMPDTPDISWQTVHRTSLLPLC